MLTREYNTNMLKETRNQAKRQYYWYTKEIRTQEQNIRIQLTSEDLNVIQEKTEISRENKFVKERDRLKEKFEKFFKSYKKAYLLESEYGYQI